jgi:hypothetical protein
MRTRNPIGGLLRAVLPFALGMVVGGIVAGIAVCGPLGRYVVAFADIPHRSFDAFFIWAVFGLPPLVGVASVWGLAALAVAWAISPVPLSLRLTPQATTALGGVAGAVCAFALAYQFELGVFAVPVALSLVVISPLSLVKRDTSE